MKNELLHGTLEVMILKTLTWDRMHGYGIARWLEQLGGEVLRVEEGSLYPALYRLEKKRLVDAEWGVSEKGRRAKFYRLTPAGRQALRASASTWSEFALAVSRVLKATDAPSTP